MAIIGLTLIGSIFVSPQIVLGYDDGTAHRALTNESAKVFNHYYPDQALTIDEVGSLIKGSFEEDRAPRWLNHFYDPVYNRGLRGLFSSKNWAQNTKLQGLRLPTSNLVREYFNDPTDYSWERAIYDYVYGDQSRGLEALGHVIHLVQDATVPEHTRDDMHPFWSTYENYTKRFTIDNLNLSQKLINAKSYPLIYPELGSYFDQLALLSNNNFFSDDTILIKKYNSPVISGEIKDISSDRKPHIFGINQMELRLVEIERLVDLRGSVLSEVYLLDDLDKKIPADYWSHLSEKAVLGSAGVIKLFFDEVEKERETKRLFDKNKSLVRKVWEKIEVGIEKIKAQFGDLLASAASLLPGTLEVRSDPDPDAEDIVVEIPTIDEGELVPEPDETEKVNESEAEQIAELLAVIENLKNRIEVIKQQQAEQSAGVLADATIQTLSPVQSLIISGGSSSGGGGSGGAVATSEIFEVATTSGTITFEPPGILAPADLSQIFTTTTIIFSGTASSGLIIFNDFSEALATVNELGEWQTEISDLAQGSSTINFYARDEAGHVSLPAVVSFQVDSLPLSVNLEIEECDHSFVADACVLAPLDPLNLTWTVSKSGDYEYELLKISDNHGEWESTSISSTQAQTSAVETGLVAGSESTEWRWQVLVRLIDAEEVVASSSEISTRFHPRPLVINEIGWAGTTASSTDEWIELHNYLDETIDLTGYYLIDVDDSWRVDLSGAISAGGYYLIERASDEVVSNRSANLVAGWGADPIEKSFDPARIGLRLYRTISIGEQVVDETPVWDKSSAVPGSLERTFENKVSIDLSTWEDNTGCDDNCALDRNGDQTFGTPGQINVASIPNLF